MDGGRGSSPTVAPFLLRQYRDNMNTIDTDNNDEHVDLDLYTGHGTSVRHEYIRGNLLPGYNGYCPLVHQTLEILDSGQFRIWNTDVELDETEIKSSPDFLIIELGAAQHDYTLETAAGAIFHSLKSLFAACDGTVQHEKFRTTIEFSEFMKIYRCNYSHLILIGHGSSDGIEFLDKRGPVAGSELAGLLGADSHTNQIRIISLCCHSGCKRLSSELSSATSVSEVIAPHEGFDLRWSVHFVTGLYLTMYISGLSVDEAVDKVSKNIDDLKMCVWRNGSLDGNCLLEEKTAC